MTARRCSVLLVALWASAGCYVAPTSTATTHPPAAVAPTDTSAGPPGSATPAPPSAPLPSRATSKTVHMTVTENYYDILGAYATDLRAEMNRLGPLDRDGVRHDAYTGWSVSWNYSYARSATGCTTGPVKVTVIITYTLPRWNAPSHASPALRRKWAHYTEHLRIHEDVHRDIGVHAGEEIKRRLEALPPRPTCGALEMAADALGKKLFAQYRMMERAYDRDTGHGATQGASFP